MSKKKNIPSVLNALKKINQQLENLKENMEIRDRHNLGPVMTIDGRDLSQTQKRYKRLLASKEALTTELVKSTSEVKKIVANYSNNLKKEIITFGYILDNNGDITSFNGDNKKQKRYREHLVCRYRAMTELKRALLTVNAINEELLPAAKTNVNTCLNNKPKFSEMNFLQQLARIFSCGMSYFLSKENASQHHLSETILSPIKVNI